MTLKVSRATTTAIISMSAYGRPTRAARQKPRTGAKSESRSPVTLIWAQGNSLQIRNIGTTVGLRRDRRHLVLNLEAVYRFSDVNVYRKSTGVGLPPA